MHKNTLSRRTFLGRGATLASAFMIAPRHVLGGPNQIPPSEKLNVAGIGCGGQAMDDLGQLSYEANIVALADVDWERGKNAFRRWPDAAKYKDFRVMLEKEAKRIDAVLVATPDHTHAVAAMAAMQLGKHVYVEKPVAHEIAEVRALMQAAKQYRVVTQMGNQGHSFPGTYETEAWVKQNAIGVIREIHCWTNRPSWPQGLTRPTDSPPVPETLDWDLWLGTAPKRPYNPCYLPHNWRGWWDFGTGALGDMGCHILDSAFNALQLGAPARVSATSQGNTAESGPTGSVVTYEFPEANGRPALKLTWYDGTNRPPIPDVLAKDRHLEQGASGSYFVGEKGHLIQGTYGNAPRKYVDGQIEKGDQATDDDLEENTSHHVNWLRACKTGKAARSDFSYAGPLTELVLLGNIAIRTGQPIEWDAANMRITNVPEANAYLKREYREGWKL